MEIRPTDQRHLEHATGYLELGMLDEAWQALDETDQSLRNSDVVLKLRIKILIAAKRWQDALVLSRKLCQDLPHDKEAFVHAELCLQELRKCDK